MRVNEFNSINGMESSGYNNESGKDKNVSKEVHPLPSDAGVDVSISDKGLKAFMENAHKIYDASDSAEELPDDLQPGLIYSRRILSIGNGWAMNSLCEEDNKKIAKALDGRLDPETRYTVEDYAKNLLESYAIIYDEIMQGYEDGTREVYWTDKNGRHRLTKEEELAYLNENFDIYAKDLKEGYLWNKKFEKYLMKTWYEIELAKYQRDRRYGYPDMSNFLISKEYVPEDLDKKLSVAARAFRGQYDISKRNEGTVSEILSGIKIWQKPD